jgi:hypothetical protein
LIINSPRRAGSHGDLVSALVLAAWALADRPVARFRAPGPVWVPPDGAGFEGVGAPSVYTSPDVLQPQRGHRSAEQIEADEIKKYATANASPLDHVQPGYALVPYGPHDPTEGF